MYVYIYLELYYNYRKNLEYFVEGLNVFSLFLSLHSLLKMIKLLKMIIKLVYSY